MIGVRGGVVRCTLAEWMAEGPALLASGADVRRAELIDRQATLIEGQVGFLSPEWGEEEPRASLPAEIFERLRFGGPSTDRHGNGLMIHVRGGVRFAVMYERGRQGDDALSDALLEWARAAAC